jgi:hypothetical protein
MLITNFRKEKRQVYEKALKIYKQRINDDSLYIDKNAYGSNGQQLSDLNALRSNSSNDLSEFWEIFDSIEKLKIIK